MRFQQLKKQSNVILRKKLYKSGKNWIVATTLALAGGIILGMPSMVVKADDVDTNTVNTQQTESVQGTVPDGSGTQKEDDGTVDQSGKPTVGAQIPNLGGTGKVETTDEEKVTPTAVKVGTSNTDESQIPKDSEEVPQATSDNTDQSDNQISNTPNEVTDSKGNIASSEMYGKAFVGTDSSSGETGSDWYLNQAGELHIGAGTWASVDYESVNPFRDKKYIDKIQKVVFDGKVVAGTEIDQVFSGMENLKEVDNLVDLDTSKTQSFEGMFWYDTSLHNVNWRDLNMSSATDISSLFSDSGMTVADFKGFTSSTIRNYTSMFARNKNLKTADMTDMTVINNADPNDYSEIQMYGIFADSSLESVNLTNVSFSNSNLEAMFKGCRNLQSLDLSSFGNISPLYLLDLLNFNDNDYYEDKDVPASKIRKIVLNSKTDYQTADFTYDSDKYAGWKNDTNRDDPTVWPLVKDSKHPIEEYSALINLYNPSTAGTHAPEGNTTWVAVERPKLTSYVQYFTPDQNQDADKPIYTTEPFESHEGGYVYIKSIPGYFAPEQSKVLVDKSGPINVVVQKIYPYNLKINISYEDNSSKNNVTNATFPAGITNVTSVADFQNELNKLPDSKNDSLDLDNTKIDLGLFGPDNQVISISDIINDQGDEDLIILPGDEKNLKAIINDVIQYMLDHGSTLEGLKDTNPIDFVDAYYDNYVASAVPQPTPSHSSGSSSSSTNTTPETTTNTIKDIKQTSATFGNRPKVQVYGTDGQVIPDIFLSPDSAWYNDESMELNGVTYYRVATDKWVNANDVYVYVANNSYVRVYKDNFGHLVNARNEKSNRELSPATEWYSDRYTEINGKKYYRVATNEFVATSEVYEYAYSNPVVTTKQVTNLYDEKGNLLSNKLPAGKSYKTDRFQMIDGLTYYRVGSNQFVKAEDVDF
ncbi:SLAP domain-containing protein [Companilactobacillus muriivasis]|uniref:SLAP domain-containing protein n=1 Tax=Companilactobacillus muriivasis TaxID=3081444 RepID=UPI0030C6E0AF